MQFCPIMNAKTAPRSTFVIESGTVRVGRFGESETPRLSPRIGADVNFLFDVWCDDGPVCVHMRRSQGTPLEKCSCCLDHHRRQTGSGGEHFLLLQLLQGYNSREGGCHGGVGWGWGGRLLMP